MYAKSFYIYKVDKKTAQDFNKKGFVEKALEAQIDIPNTLKTKPTTDLLVMNNSHRSHIINSVYVGFVFHKCIKMYNNPGLQRYSPGEQERWYYFGFWPV